MIGPLKTGLPLRIPGFDFSSLNSIYTMGARLGSAEHASILRNGVLKSILDNKGIAPPWTLQQPTTADSETVKNIFSSKSLIDKNDPLFNRSDLTDDYKHLFALWKGLSKLKEIAEFGKTDKRADSLRLALDRQYQTKQQEIFDYIGNTTFNGVSLLQGLKISTLESSAKRPDSTGTSYSYYGFPLVQSQTEYIGASATTVRTDPIAGLTGTEQFTINITENGVTTPILIDLANVTGGLTIDNIADYINAQFVADGNIATTVEVKRENETSYKFQFNLSEGETISLVSDVATQEAAVYVSASFGSGALLANDLNGGALVKLDGLAGATPNQAFRTDINTDKADSANGTAVDSEGNVYVVGTTAGNMDNQINVATNDVYLNKYDASGVLVWTRMLGASESASGFAVAVDSLDNVVVAGQTLSLLTDTAYGGNADAFVTKFDSTGQEQWTHQASPYANDAALGLTIDSNNDVFLSGFADSAIAADQTYAGGRDAFITKLDSAGTLVYNNQFGTAADEIATAVTVDNAGNLFVAYQNATNALVRKYADVAGTTTPIFEADLGAYGTDGGVTGLAIDGLGQIYASGYTNAASLNGTVANAYSGGVDGYVSRINATTGAIDWVSYQGTAGDDKGLGIAVNGADVYVTGETTGQLTGATQIGTSDGFVAKLDDTGALQWAHQFGGAFATRGTSISFDNSGTSVLTRLGLREGTIPGDSSGTLIAQTTARAGQQFTIKVGNAPAQTITIASTDTFEWLTYQMNKILGQNGRASFNQNGSEQFLMIKAENGATVELGAGPPGFDALGGLGFRPATIYGVPSTDIQTAKAKSDFELGFVPDLNMKSTDSAGNAVDIIENAMREVRKAFDFLLHGPNYDPLDSLPPPVPEAMAKKIAAMESTLAFLQSQVPTLATGLKLKI